MYFESDKTYLFFRFSDFQVCSLSSTDELKELFLKQGLDEIYSNHIHCLIKR